MNPDQSLLLIDSDAFCKLAAARLLDDALVLLDVTKQQCARLPSLPPMLRKGRLRKMLGDAVADGLLPIAESIAAMGQASEEWLDPLVGNPGIDAGEAQIFALAAERGLRVLTGDKRALAEVSKLPKFRAEIDDRVVTLEAVLLGLTNKMSEAELRARGRILAKYDKMARAVFASDGSSLEEGLMSYLADLERNTDPMKVWRMGRETQEK